MMEHGHRLKQIGQYKKKLLGLLKKLKEREGTTQQVTFSFMKDC